MVVLCPLFEGLDLLDLWHLYGQGGYVQQVRNVSVSKVSRRSWELVADLGLSVPPARGAPDPRALGAGSVLLLRQAYQQWRLEQGCLKVLPTFAASVALRQLKPQLDVLPDLYLTAEALADHLRMRRVDLIISSSLDLAGELIQEALSDPESPFAVVPLFEDEVRLAVNPEHPLAGLREATPEDCAVFPSAGYPQGVARLAETTLRERGLWRFACKRNHFVASEWMLDMRSPTGLCYETIFLSELMPESRDLAVISFAQPVFQTKYVVMLKELAEQPELEAIVALVRRSVLSVLERSTHAFTLC
jgi:DNA-binding transcriptional LysR family regulator